MNKIVEFLDRSSLFHLTWTRFRLILREPEAIFWIFVFPILLAGGLGIAFRNRPADVLPVGATTQQMVQALNSTGELQAQLVSEAQSHALLATGRVVLVAVALPQGLRYDFDDTNPDGRMARRAADFALERAAGRHDVLQTSDRIVHEVGSRYIDFVVPGLLGMNLMGSAMWGLGFSIVDMRQKKLLKRMVASPMPRWEFLASFLLSRLVMLVLEVAALLGFAWIAFRVPFRGSLWQLAGLCVLTSLAFSALGLLVASRARTLEAVSGLMNVAMFPMWIFSGVFFSASRFPEAVQPLVRMLPLTAANNVLRANMLEGVGLSSMSADLGILALWCVIPFVLSLRIFRWR